MSPRSVHIPCPSPDCDSTDAATEYADGSIFCFSCRRRFDRDGNPWKGVTPTLTELVEIPRTDAATAQLALLKGKPVALPDRKITEKTCRIYDYIASTYLHQPAQVACYRDEHGLITAQHVRRAGKQFAWIGRIKGSKVQLFGQHLASSGRLIITEGEIDAMSVYEVLAEYSPWKDATVVASIPDGVQSAKQAISAQLLWIGGFDSVIIFFDQDEPGKEGAQAVAEVIGPKASVVTTFGYHDANDAWVAGDGKAIREALLSAKRHRPEAVVHAPELITGLLNPETKERGIPFPWDGFNRLTLGLRPGDLMLVAAGTSIGKSAITRSHALFLAKTGIKVAYVALEESCETTLEMMLSEELGFNPPFHADTPEQRRRRDPGIIANALSTFAPNLFLLNRHIDESFDSFVRAVKHYVVAEGCKVVFLDHFSILADGIDLKADQRRAIDKCIKELKSMCVHQKFSMVVVCHLSRDKDGLSPEDGGEPKVSMLRGSQSLAQIPDYIVLLQRNPKAEDPVEANMTYCWLRKNRPLGRNVGLASKLHYLESCRFFEVTP